VNQIDDLKKTLSDSLYKLNMAPREKYHDENMTKLNIEAQLRQAEIDLSKAREKRRKAAKKNTDKILDMIVISHKLTAF